MKTNDYNYPSLLVSVEIAKKLKKIGFNEPCLVKNVETHSEDYNFINFKEEMYSEAIVLLEDVEFVNNKDLKDKLGIYKDFVLRTAIPTWEQVFEWFRNKGLVAVIATAEVLNEGDPQYYASVDDIKKGGYYYDIGYAKNYEEARELALNKLIELYENK